MKDPAGSNIVASFGWVQSQPDYDVMSDIGTRDWVIGLSDARTNYSEGASLLAGIVEISGLTF